MVALSLERYDPCLQVFPMPPLASLVFLLYHSLVASNLDISLNLTDQSRVACLPQCRRVGPCFLSYVVLAHGSSVRQHYRLSCLQALEGCPESFFCCLTCG